MEFYVDEKQRQKRKRLLKIKIYGGMAVFLLLLAAVLYIIIYSPLFQITRISVNWTQTSSDAKEQMINNLKFFFANQSKIAKFLGTDNILIWNKKVGDFLKQNPQIEVLSIEKNYFRREVKIDFQKRERFGVWCLATQTNASGTQTDTEKSQRESESCWWFDKNGISFESAPKIEGEMIYKVEDFSGKQLVMGNEVMEGRLFANLLKLFDVLEKNNLGVRTLRIKDLSLQEATMESTDSSMPKIYFSLRFDPAFVAPAINALKEYGLNRIDYIDFRVENRAYYKPRYP
jgi:hypothetical protein